MSQSDSTSSSLDSLTAQSDSSRQLTPEEISIQRSKDSYQRWSDQFPSYFIMRFNGLPLEKNQETARKVENDDWKFWFSLFLLAFIAIIRFGYPKDFEELGHAFRNWGMNQQVLRELTVGIPFGVVLLNIFSVLTLSFFVFLLLSRFNLVLIQPSWALMIFAAMVTSAVFVVRYFLLKSAEIIFPFRKEMKLFNFYEIQINRLAGVVLFPLLLLIAFGSPFISLVALYVSLTVVIAMFLIRYIKGFSIGISYFGAHVIHFLLYICALEIAPVLIIIRLLLNLGTIRISL